MIKVQINTLAIPSFRQGGAGFFAATLIEGLSNHPDIELTSIVSSTIGEEIEVFAPSSGTVQLSSRPRGALSKSLNYLASTRRPWQLDLGFEPRSIPAADVVHWPIAFMHAPAVSGAKRILTIHDVQHLAHPEFFSRRDRILRRMRWLPSARHATHVITSSAYSKQMICDAFDLDEERVSVVPLATRPTLGLDGETQLPGPLVGLEDPWFLFPASPLPNKNHERLFRALAHFNRTSNASAKLALTGPTMHSWDPVKESAQAAGVTDCVHFLGHVSEAELAGLYANATGLIFPSFFEGFGLPVLEAMGAGCPVTVANAASLPEIVGPTAKQFDPYDVEDIADAMAWLTGLGTVERQRVISDQQSRAATFSTQRMITGTIASYKKALI